MHPVIIFDSNSSLILTKINVSKTKEMNEIVIMKLYLFDVHMSQEHIK